MKNIILLITLLVAGLSISQTPTTLKPDHYNSEKVVDKAEFTDNGKTYKIKKSDYSRGIYIQKDKKWLKHGIWYALYEGRVTNKTTYVYGLKEGEYVSYHSNDKIMYQRTYKNNKKHGKQYYYSDDGDLYEECIYQNGLKEGEQLNYHSNGTTVQFKKTFVSGKRNGITYQYNDKGEVVAKTTYNMGEKVGKTIWY